VSPRLCILTQYYPPEMGAPQARLSELAERLAARDWVVEVLTAVPNYPTGQVFAGYPRTGSVVETVSGIRVVRVPLWPSKTGLAARLATYLSFALSAAALGPRRCARPDLLWVESPPLFIGLAAWRLAHRWRCPYVLNVSDLWPSSVIEMGAVKPGLATRLVEALERRVYTRAAGVTGQSDEILAGVVRASPGTRTALITNGVDPARFGRQLATPEARELLGTEPGPVFIFAGLFGYAQGLGQILDLAAQWPADQPARFVLVGDGPERRELEARIEAEGLSRVRLLPAQPREKVPALLAAADAAVISLGGRLVGAVPSKIYEAMGSELPILLIATGEAARRVVDAGCGTAVAPGDREGLLRAALRLAGDAGLRAELGAAGRRAAEEVYSRDRVAGRLDRFLREILAEPTRAPTPSRM
jgi:glycosyltransferase involved in cell wall biosynthesis